MFSCHLNLRSIGRNAGQCCALPPFQQWSLLTAVLMSCIDDGYVDLSLALLVMCGLKSPGGNRWMWGVDEHFLNADPYYGLRMGLQIRIWNTGSLNKLLLRHQAKPLVHLENPRSFLFVYENKCAVWRWCEILIFVCKYTKTCQKQQAGFGVQFSLAGFDRGGDSISNAGSSFWKSTFSVPCTVKDGSQLMKRTVNWERVDDAVCSLENWLWKSVCSYSMRCVCSFIWSRHFFIKGDME